jgi:glycine/D-amino acid oxidase-like deaminating enzyme
MSRDSQLATSGYVAASRSRRAAGVLLAVPSRTPTVDLTALTQGYVTSVSTDAGSYTAQYEIQDVPLAQQLQVTLTVGPVFGEALAVRVDGPPVFTLTGASPQQGSEDFLITTPAAIR